MSRLVAVVLMASAGATWAAGPPDAATWGRFGKIEEATRLNLRGVALYQAGKVAEATSVFAELLKVRQGLYPSSSYPQGHPDLAISVNNLGFLHQAQGDFAKAEPLYRLALEMSEAQYPTSRYPHGHPDLARGLNNLAALYQTQGDHAKAEAMYRRALEMYERMYPKSRYPQGHPELAISLNNLAALHQAQDDQAKAEALYRRALEMVEAQYPRARYPQGHPEVASSLNNLAHLHQAQGDTAKAEPLFRRALDILESQYPKSRFPQGHPDLARGLNNLAELYRAQGNLAKAEPLHRRALKMREDLYPKERYPRGHPDLALSLNNLAFLLQVQGGTAKAEPLYRRALKMYEMLYPRGHAELARSQNNLAALYQIQGDYASAEEFYRRALERVEAQYPRSRYPQGHPDLAASLNNLATLHFACSDYAKAAPLYRLALEMYTDSTRSLATASEATALNYAASAPTARDAYLSTMLHISKSDAYPAVWQSKASLARVAEREHLAVLATSSQKARQLRNAVLALKRDRERLLLTPARIATAKARDERLDEIEEEIRKKEANLRSLLPAMKRSDDLAKRKPADLQKALPADAVFLDLLRYWRIEQDPKVKGEKGEKRTLHYVAFVVTCDALVRVELGEAKPIEDALALWRRAVVEGSPSEPKYAGEVHRLLWSPLVKHLLAKTSTVFVSPDAALHGVPWAALRDTKTNRILLEEYAVAVVPHGPMLLDRLTEERRKTPNNPTFLVMGGVAYDQKPGSPLLALHRGPVGDGVKWGPLAGTTKEVRQIVALAEDRKVLRLDGGTAEAQALLADLPRAETAHLATHGFFADARFRTVFQLDAKLFERLGSERSSAGTRSPLVLSGLVCAGANVEGTPNRGVVTADAIVGLDLRKLNLAVLSACETGLGDVAGGEGVYGLVRAFHVAGTRNVVASLWKVDDEATAALMVLFYRNLWGKEKVSPREALRRAQLAIYRDPVRIPEWAAGRGPLPTPVAGEVKPADKGPKAKTSPARAWAAFVISGPGN